MLNNHFNERFSLFVYVILSIVQTPVKDDAPEHGKNKKNPFFRGERAIDLLCRLALFDNHFQHKLHGPALFGKERIGGNVEVSDQINSVLFDKSDIPPHILGDLPGKVIGFDTRFDFVLEIVIRSFVDFKNDIVLGGKVVIKEADRDFGGFADISNGHIVESLFPDQLQGALVYLIFGLNGFFFAGS